MGFLQKSANLALSLGATALALGCAAEAAPSVTTEQGVVYGFAQNETNVYLGIPFGQSTAGEHRWKAPRPAASYEGGSFEATAYGPTCAQAMSGTAIVAQSEDCLNLNVWTPQNGSDLPVFVYVYGGAMVTGGNSNAQWQGYNFARKDVIYVNLNYRESVYASPNALELEGSSKTQNFGILDVELALEWIYDNIEAFGGNKSRIVLGGHSSGGVHVDDYLWNHPDTFLAGAIEMSANAQSGPAITPVGVGLQQVVQDMIDAGVSLDCTAENYTLACLRKVDTYDFQTSYFNSTSNTWFSPVVDNITRFSNYTDRFVNGHYPKSLPLIVGNSDQEGKIFGYVYASENTNFSSWIRTFDADLAFVPADELLAAYNSDDYSSVSFMSGASYGDARFHCATDYFLDLRAEEQNTWIYRWFGNYSNVLGVADIGPSHGSEVPFFHGGNECFSKLTGVTAAEQDLADYMNDWFVAWIKNPSAGPGWDQATPVNGPLALLGVPGNEEAIESAETGTYNQRCQNTYKPNYPNYPVVLNPVELAASS
ncbi:carboxylesterase [Aspergillus saccharolyticus JOP 1030-1]|uniref:Carboxylic ester hydrolase n=1 Tax=Aspergillus saccharolyticus JOP 1030-1 TaxID=1450539 RepID=A0A318ZBG8_9EURO|nr:carboxylesterase [Aspergillus saccharolyticus JOP 1030-1]PYH44659.1 carboxylesterase [Aspergillus saccharolyticus JOP 1030-1]